jgi:glycosyltransferase involved in cell wall biosynthesis
MAPRCHAGFIGGDYPFNLEGVIHFCTHILPLIRRRCPGFRFLVTGRVAAPLRLAAPFWPGVELCDHVADAQTFYDQIRVSVVPLLSGTGVSIKTLEALRFGKPVVSTTVGARGVATGAGQPLLDIADDPEAFAERVVARCAEPAAASAAAPAQAEAGLAEAEFRRAFDALIGRYLRGRAASLRPVAEGGGWGSLETGAAPR